MPVKQGTTSPIDGNPRNDFDHITWRNRFEKASAQGEGFRELRAEIFRDTVKFVQNGGYYAGNVFVKIEDDGVTGSAEYFEAPGRLAVGAEPAKDETRFSVIDADCLETAHLLLKSGLSPCVLNLASRQNPGGGVLNGAGAQEENLFRRTNLFRSLYQFADYAPDYGIKKHEKSYPLNRDSGGIYSGAVTVFRGSEKNGYCLLKTPFKVSFVTVPAINRPTLTKKNGKLYITDDLIGPAKEKIRTILRIAGKYRHDSLVLGAFGCGAYANPPNHAAELFRDVFLEDEFRDRFKVVVFSIFDDHNSRREHNPNGNVLPFLELFDGR